MRLPGRKGAPASGPRRGARPSARRGVLCVAAACLVAAGVLLRASLGPRGDAGGDDAAFPSAAAAAAGGGGGGGDEQPGGRSAAEQQLEEEMSSHPLYSRIDRELEPFKQQGGITLRMVEQAYCQGSRGSFRLQVRGGEGRRGGAAPHPTQCLPDSRQDTGNRSYPAIALARL